MEYYTKLNGTATTSGKKPTSKCICNHSLHRDTKTECVTHFSLKVHNARMFGHLSCTIPTRVKWPFRGITIIPSHLPMLLVSDQLMCKLSVFCDSYMKNQPTRSFLALNLCRCNGGACRSKATCIHYEYFCTTACL